MNRSYHRVYGRLSELDLKEVLNEGMKRLLFLIHYTLGSTLRICLPPSCRPGGKILDNTIYAHQGSIFHVIFTWKCQIH